MMGNKLIIFGWICSLTTLYSTAAQPSPDTLSFDLKTVLRETAEVSPDIRVALSNVSRASARHELAQSSRILPDATAFSAVAVVPGIENPNGTPLDELYLDPAVRNDYGNLKPFGQAEVSLVQPIYTWGALRGAIQAASASTDLEVARAQETIIGASLRAAELYYNVLLTNELQRLVDRAGDVVAMAMREINRLLEEGDPEVDDADRYEVLITQQEYERRIVEVNQARQIAHVALRRQLMVPDSTHMVPVQDALKPLSFILESLGYYQQNALQYRPEILQAEAGLVATDALVRVARADYYPQSAFGLTLSVSAAANRFRQPNPYISDGFRRTSARTGFGLRQKLNFKQTHARVAQAEAHHNSVRYLAIAAEQGVLVELEQSWRNVIVQEAALATKDSSLTVSKEWLRVEQVNFDLDLGDTENLVKAVQANLTLEAEYYEAVSRYNMAIITLLANSGLLTHETYSFFE